MRLKFSLLALVAFAATAAAARADILVSGTADSGLFAFNLDLKVTPDAVAGFDITSASGTVNGTAVSLLPNPTPGTISTSPLGAFFYDNIVYTSGNPFDYWGVLLAFGPPAVPNEINIYYNNSSANSGIVDFYTAAGGYGPNPIDSDPNPPSVITTTPEPSSLMLLGTGILAAAGATRRRMKRLS